MAFSLNYSFVMIILVASIFTVLYAAMPSDFFLNQADYNPNLINAEVREEFKATDLAVYSSYAQDTAFVGYSSIRDAPDAPQWATSITNRFIEVWWDNEYIPDVGSIGLKFEIRDTEKRNFIIDYYVNLETCRIYTNESEIGIHFARENLTPYENDTQLYLTAKGKYVSTSIILKANGTDTLGEAWDTGNLGYSITYEIDFDAMKPSAWQLIGQLITFQSPDFGVPGLIGDLISYVIGLVFWLATALIAYTIITKLIPTISGGLDN